MKRSDNMNYYKDDEVVIRNMEPCDVQIIKDKEKGMDGNVGKVRMKKKNP